MARFEESQLSWLVSNSPTFMPKIDINLKVAANTLLNEAQGITGLSSKNVVCSPLSLEFVLHMLATGSQGHTLHQLLGFIGSNSLEFEDLNLKSTRIMSVVSSDSSLSDYGGRKGPHISFVNCVWFDQGYPLKRSYKELLECTYKAKAKNVDFQNQVDQVIEDVNSWVVNNTRGLISQIFSPGTLTRDSILILGNALYFKGVWVNNFDKSFTRHKDFYLLNGDTAAVPFMTSFKSYFYGATDSFKLLKVPYERGANNGQFSMYFILPHERNGL